ncbi:hypothetical protein JKP88DRAFT_229780 [Tribonema minus]|uniref:Uncharacterized protein n=1 Tax=Tribonema minus TaxID=303371 RepID=A0A836CPD1_9STRA|nr:hypothetical protein JKP88DRAFT_229780 [Tribonema minus]
MPSALRYATWDRLDFPSKRRCAFAFAEGRKQVGPVEWHVTADAFLETQRTYFVDLVRVGGALMDVMEDERWQWHMLRKRRKRAAIYGALLFSATVVLDTWTQFA